MKTVITRATLLIVFIVVTTTSLFSQEAAIEKIKWGVEYDLMAPRIGQWHSVNINGWIGHGRIKHSLVLAKININDKHLTEESFEKDNLTAFGYRGEIFSHKELKRWSTGIIIIYSMHNVVTSINQQSGKFNTLFFGVPLGYTWVIWKHLTINPNVSILIPLTNRTVKIGIDEVQQAPWGLEPGIRIGYKF